MPFTIICDKCKSNNISFVLVDNGWVGQEIEEHYISCVNCGHSEKINFVLGDID
jgi:DNA-directed RNA polymerase subunit M/transcription elongation factor TFIIS